MREGDFMAPKKDALSRKGSAVEDGGSAWGKCHFEGRIYLEGKNLRGQSLTEREGKLPLSVQKTLQSAEGWHL